MLASRDFKGIRRKRLPIFMLGAPDNMVHARSDRWLEGAASNNAGRTAPLFGSRHCNGSDFTHRVSIGASPERRPDRIYHENAGDRPAGSRSYDAEPAGVWIACLQPGADWNGRTSPYRRQHWTEIARRRRMAVRKTWQDKAPRLAQVAHWH